MENGKFLPGMFLVRRPAARPVALTKSWRLTIQASVRKCPPGHPSESTWRDSRTQQTAIRCGFQVERYWNLFLLLWQSDVSAWNPIYRVGFAG
jgi:hypothetical protein